jgi:GntR family transcriptional regulator
MEPYLCETWVNPAGIGTPRSPKLAVKDVVGRLAINPNTVLKAYRELEYEGLVAARPGLGTFVTRTLGGGSPAAIAPLRRELQRWLAKARRTGLDDEIIEALMLTTFRSATEGEENIA